MKKLFVSCLLAASLASAARAQNPLGDLRVSGTLDFETQYVYRGKKVSDAAFEPSLDIRYAALGGAFYATTWSNLPAGRRGAAPGPNQVDELRFYTGYTRSLSFLTSGLSADVGNTYYWYAENGGNANALSRSDEIYLSLSYDTAPLLGFNLRPTLSYAHDWILDQNVVEGSLSYEWDLSKLTGVKGLSAVPRASVGWLEAGRLRGDQLNAGVPNWRDSYIYYSASLDLNYMINEYTLLFVGVRYSGNNDGTVFYPVYATTPQIGGSANNLWAGAGITFGLPVN